MRGLGLGWAAHPSKSCRYLTCLRVHILRAVPRSAPVAPPPQHYHQHKSMQPRISLTACLLLACAATLACAQSSGATVFYPASCEQQCSNPNNFHVALPSIPDATKGNRVEQWTLAFLSVVSACTEVAPWLLLSYRTCTCDVHEENMPLHLLMC